MKSLSSFITFVHALTQKELKNIKRQVCVFDSDLRVNSLSIKLLELICKFGNKLDEEGYRKKLYGNSEERHAEPFRKLVERVRDKAYEATLLDVNIENHPYYVPLTEATIKARKSLPLIYSTLVKGITLHERKRMLDSFIKICYQYELYDELVILLKHKLEEIDFNDKSANLEDRLSEIEAAKEMSGLIFKSKCYVYKYIYGYQFKSIDQSQISGEIKKSIDELYDYYSRYKLKNVLYNYYLLSAQYGHFTYDYEYALKVLNELRIALLESDSLLTMNRLTLCHTNLSYTQSFLFRFDDALRSMVEARKYYNNQRPEFINFYKESEVFLNIYLKNYPEALDLLQQIKSSEVEGMELQASRTNYLLAVVMFLMGDYKKSNFLLQDTREIEGDKEGWNIGIRMLQIFLTLQTEKVDLADQRIGSLRKHIERTIKMKSVRKRDVVIFRILSHLSRSGFDFKEVWDERQKDFQLLRSNDADYRWIPRSHELILFDQWFESKVKRRDYVPVFPSPVENDAPLTN